MSAEPRVLNTEAETGLATNYQTIKSSLPGLPAVAAVRDTAFAKFEERGLPHRRVEAWKYTDLRARMRTALPIAPAPTAAASARMHASLSTFGSLDRYRLVIADGFFQEALSDREVLLAEGIEVATLAEFLTFDSDEVLRLLDPPAGGEDDAMMALNAALASDGVVVLVPDGCAPAKPIEIVHLSTGGEAASWFSRSHINIGKGAAPRLLVSAVGPNGVAYQSNSFLSVSLKEGADVSIADLQAGGDSGLQIASFSAELSAKAALRHVAVTKGNGTARAQSYATINGEGAALNVAGANMLSGEAHGDVSWRIDHSVPSATSRVLYKNTAADTAFGAFQGLILVRPEAQQTDGRMMTRTLLLSDEAQFVAKPELEIYADDVQCGHGATIGQVEEDALFYLMARGIPKAEAQALLVRAFLLEAVETISDRAIAASLETVINGWLGQKSL